MSDRLCVVRRAVQNVGGFELFASADNLDELESKLGSREDWPKDFHLWTEEEYDVWYDKHITPYFVDRPGDERESDDD